MMRLRNLRQWFRSMAAASGDARPSLWQLCTRSLWEKNVTAMSAALSFRTIFALVPLLVLAFLLLKTVGIVENSKQSLRHVLEASGFSQIVLVEGEGAPGAASQPDGQGDQRVFNVADEIERLVERVEQKLTIGRVGPIGFVLLIYTATTLLASMETSLNRIFGERRSRSLFRSLPLYWSVMTLGPILLAAGLFLGRRATEILDHATGAARVLAGIAEWAAPFMGCLLVLWTIYKLLPNTEVRWQPALLGAAVATPIWLIAKWGFAVYVARFVRTGNLYGVLGLVPLFLIWLNLLWLILLFGAEVASLARGLMPSSVAGRGRNGGSVPSDLLAALLAVGGPYEKGLGPVSARQAANQLQISPDDVGRVLDVLTEMGLICPVRGRWGPAFVLARPAAAIPVMEIMQVPKSQPPAVPASYPPAIAAAMACFNQHAQSSLSSVTIADLLKAARGVEGDAAAG